MPFNNEKKVSYGHNLILMLLLTIITFTVILKGNDMNHLISSLKSADGRWLLLGLYCMFVFVSCEALNMYQISRSLGWPLGLSRCEQYAFIGFYFSFHHTFGQRWSAGSNILYEERPYSSGLIFCNDFVYCICLPDGYASARRHYGSNLSEPCPADSRPFKISPSLWVGYKRRRRHIDGLIPELGKTCSKITPFFPPGRNMVPSGKASAGEPAAYSHGVKTIPP